MNVERIIKGSILFFILIVPIIGTYFGIFLLLKSKLIKLFIDAPGNRKVHQYMTPRAGGLCIIIVFLITIVCWNSFFASFYPVLENNLLLSIIIITIGIFIIGLLDDTIFLNINNKYKFIYEICLVSFVVIFFHIHFDVISFLPNKLFALGVLNIPITIIWIICITNAINIIDGMDGLAGSTLIVSIVTIGIISFSIGQIAITILCGICIALLLGFLIFNISPARIFLGDSGSLFFGIILGIVTVYMVQKSNTKFSIFILPLIFGFPIIDVSIAMFRRFFKSILNGNTFRKSLSSTFIADSEHIHHRLNYKGLNHNKICVVLSLLSILFNSSAMILFYFYQIESIIYLTISLSLSLVYFLFRLHFFERFLSKSEKKTKKIPIKVINANDLTQHSIVKYQQNSFHFKFEPINDIYQGVNGHKHKDFVLFFNNSQDDLKENLKSVLLKYSDENIVVAAYRESFESLRKDNFSDNIKFVNSEALYIPHLFWNLHMKISKKTKIYL